MFFLFNKNNKECSGGFSLIEMITVTAIFLIITGIILVNAPQFRDRLSIDLVANQVAINIRGAQVYGSATKSSVLQIGNNNIYPSFGVHFNKSENNKFVLYGANLSENTHGSDGNFQQDQEGYTTEETYLLPQGFIITDLFTGDNESVSNLDILYRRPKLDAEFYSGDLTVACDKAECPNASVVIQSVKENKKKKVVIYNNGQIAVENYE